MSEHSKIEWCDHTWSPWEGCQKVSPGCDHCYAEARNARYGGGAALNWGPGAPRRRTVDASWKLPLRWDRRAAATGTRPRVFPSLCDPFDKAVDPAWRMDFFRLIANTPHLDWLLLTKRIGNVAGMCAREALLHDMLASRVWLGITVVDQHEAERDIDKLIAAPAFLRFISFEPLLAPIDATRWFQSGRIDWVIAGGESGPHARPMHPGWARALRDQCDAAGVPFLFKQWGEWADGRNVQRQTRIVKTAGLFGDEWMFGEENLASDGHIDDEPDLYRIGKKEAGRYLDGRTHNAFPRGLA